MCESCGKGFNYKSLFEGHKASHTLSKPFSCDKCKATFTYKTSLSRHNCNNEKNITCEKCGKNFKSKRYLKDHEMGHTNPERYQCYVCGDFFKYWGSFYKHKIRTGHN